MKSSISILGRTSAVLGAAALLSFGTQAQAATFTDDFSSLSDSPSWTHLSAFALSSGQTWSAATGAYQMTAPPNGYNPGNGAFGFVGSVAGVDETDVSVSADVVAFQGPGGFGSFAVGARLGNLSTPLGLTGYAAVWEPYANSGAGELTLMWLGGSGVFNDIGSQAITLNPLNDYTLKLHAVGTTITAEILQVGNLSPLALVYAYDSHYASGRSGLIEVVQQPLPTVDTTWDNFVATSVVPEPGTATLLSLGVVGFLARRRLCSNM